jgi:hypothetical protein
VTQKNSGCPDPRLREQFALRRTERTVWQGAMLGRANSGRVRASTHYPAPRSISLIGILRPSDCQKYPIRALVLFQDSNLRNLSARTPPSAQFPPEQLVLSTHAQRAASMTTIVLVGVASVLVVFAIIVKARGGKPKKPEKWEKAQIVKQLLALSESEDMKRIPRQQSVSQRPTPRRRAAAASTSSSRTVRPA